MKIAEHLTKPISKILKFLLRRLVFVTVAIILQMIWMTYMVVVIGEYSKAIEWVFRIFSITVVIYIANKDDNPAYKLAWTIPILLFPIFGGFLYLVLGDKQPAKKLRMELEQSIEDTEFLLGQDYGVMERLEQEDYQVAGQAKYIDQYGGYPIYENSDAKYYPSGEAMFEELIEDLKKAKHYIFMEFFIVSRGYMWDTILEVLKDRVNDGVEVRFMYDDVGCVDLLPYKYYKELERFGIMAMPFNPIKPFVSTAWNNRDHRKILVIDGKVAFTGGINLADEYMNIVERFGYWKDTGVMLKGDAVRSFTLLFLQMWNVTEKNIEGYSRYLNIAIPTPETSDGYVMGYGDDPYGKERVGESVYLHMINTATKYLHIVSPYLVIDNVMMSSLKFAAKRGVDVKIIMPGIPDKEYAYCLARTYYAELIEAGVEIYEFTPGFTHAKMFISDDEKATVGTINLDYRSLFLHFEDGCFIYKNKVINRIEEDYQKMLSASKRVSLMDCRNRPTYYKICGMLLRLLAPLM
mgnify:CR=1 FL=1